MKLQNQKQFHHIISEAHWWVNEFGAVVFFTVYNKNYYKITDLYERDALISLKIEKGSDIENIYDEILNQLNYF